MICVKMSILRHCPYNDCDNEFVASKITEITSCGENGLDGYSTRRLSLIVKNSNVKNIYAIYGDDEIYLNQ